MSGTPPRTAWIGGLVIGVGAGALSLVIPFVGWTIGAAFLVGAAMSGAVVASVGGFLLGGGAIWAAMLLQSTLSCGAYDGQGRGCIAPDLTPWFMAAVVMLVIGGLATLVTARR